MGAIREMAVARGGEVKGGGANGVGIGGVVVVERLERGNAEGELGNGGDRGGG